MKFSEIIETLNARVVSEASDFNSCQVSSVVVSDLMSDVLVSDKPSPLILTSLSTDQAIRTASMVDASGVVITQNKPLPEGIDKLAEELDITLLHTPMDKFKACVLLGKLLERNEIEI
ncbi:DRTGG domain-containing protein [Chitinispirillales bacterium ANBcel5]|uniref:DRTGG domain-containing protein n=1 Tax=Cellulosispirillum alkaliphilum TaxID=3039283 RepID=UPI002A5851B8|nr:DRTGG domain-containing protein [Chitinispirillales bacterium ANBcel5]